MKLNWKSYGDMGRIAKGDKGTWRVTTDGMWWWLSLQLPGARGLSNRGKFLKRSRAEEFAQEREDNIPIVAAEGTP